MVARVGADPQELVRLAERIARAGRRRGPPEAARRRIRGQHQVDRDRHGHRGRPGQRGAHRGRPPRGPAWRRHRRRGGRRPRRDVGCSLAGRPHRRDHQLPVRRCPAGRCRSRPPTTTGRWPAPSTSPPSRSCSAPVGATGAHLEGQPIRCSEQPDVATALVGTGFAYHGESRRAPRAPGGAAAPEGARTCGASAPPPLISASWRAAVSTRTTRRAWRRGTSPLAS